MPKYKCLNEDCSKFNKIEGRNSRGYIDSQRGYVDTGLVCTECGQDCELQFEGYSTNLLNHP